MSFNDIITKLISRLKLILVVLRKGYKDLIFSFIIGVFVFFGIFGWTLVVGIVLALVVWFKRVRKLMYLEEKNIEIKESLYFTNMKYEYASAELESELNKKRDYEIMEERYLNDNKELSKIIAKEKDAIKLKNIELEELRAEIEEMKVNKRNSNFNQYILSAGKYKGKVDIPVGCYSLRILSGRGSVETNSPERIYIRFSTSEDDREKYEKTECYNNLEIAEKTVLKISDNAVIEFTYIRDSFVPKELPKLERLIDLPVIDKATNEAILNGVHYTKRTP